MLWLCSRRFSRLCSRNTSESSATVHTTSLSTSLNDHLRRNHPINDCASTLAANLSSNNPKTASDSPSAIKGSREVAMHTQSFLDETSLQSLPQVDYAQE